MRDGNHFTRDLDQRLADVFRLYVGAGRRYSWAALSDATNIPQATLKSYARGVAIPLHAALRLIAVLPPEAGNMLIEPSGYRLTPVDPEEDGWAGLGAEATGFCHDLFDALADGFVNHVEDARLKLRVRKMIAKAEAMVA